MLCLDHNIKKNSGLLNLCPNNKQKKLSQTKKDEIKKKENYSNYRTVIKYTISLSFYFSSNELAENTKKTVCFVFIF